jgi:hypothetical protein
MSPPPGVGTNRRNCILHNHPDINHIFRNLHIERKMENKAAWNWQEDPGGGGRGGCVLRYKENATGVVILYTVDCNEVQTKRNTFIVQ